ncbi:hypothetical protein CRE_13349 [Caenorhabditis remanei]|uniref:Sdz-33 F-box domain-containing protein n=1 Tax=Caenorhabditis remanei TaxID=31234 RepID=E3M8B7_CAERE|nr:hypothetical protein CRE_13349 [Caenorhabditis remanei]
MTKTKIFPLFSLPYLALKDVIISLDVLSRMNLSICSKRSKRISSALTIPELQLSLILCEDSKSIIEVIATDQREDVDVPLMEHVWNMIPTDIKEDFGKVIEISKLEWEFYHDPSVNLTGILCNRLLEFYGWSSWTEVVFQKDIEQSDFDKFPVLLPSAGEISFDKGEVTREELDTLFMKHGNIQLINLDCRYPEGYGMWCARTVGFFRAPQNIEDLLKMDCEKVGCAVTGYKNSDVNRFLKHWLQSTNCGNHKYLKREIRLCDVENDSNMLEDLPVTPWNPKQRGQFFHFRNPHFDAAIDCSKGFDLLRDDGVLATVISDEDEFTFNIWNERFPDIPKEDFPPNSVFY